MKNIKSTLSGIWNKISTFVYVLLGLLVVFGCIFLIVTASTGLWNSLGETVQSWVAGGIAFYVAISVLGFCGSILVIFGFVFGYSALIAWLSR